RICFVSITPPVAHQTSTLSLHDALPISDSQLQVEDLNWSAWQDAAICHTGGVSLSTEPARSTTLAAMEHTRRVGSIVSFDVNVRDRKSTRLNSSHQIISYAVFCLKKKNQ